MKKGLYVLSQAAYDCIYDQQVRSDISSMIDIYASLQTRETLAEDMSVLNDAEVIFSGWETPLIDEDFILNAPNLKAVFYGSGSTKGVAGPGFFDAGILLTSAYMVNAIPVAEYCLSQILFCLKSGYQFVNSLRQTGDWPAILGTERNAIAGCFGSTVGLISIGAISRKIIEFLKSFNVNVLVSNSYLTDQQALELGVEKVTINELFAQSDVVSLHCAENPETKGLVTGQLLASMKTNSSFINTARGSIVKQEELIQVLKNRTDLVAILDVTDPEPPHPDSELYALPNIIVTPHIAGSTGRECVRMGKTMVEELQRYLNGQPFKYGITKKEFEVFA
jgi:phosphoglycerate dehydrogenase-like enzyme